MREARPSAGHSSRGSRASGTSARPDHAEQRVHGAARTRHPQAHGERRADGRSPFAHPGRVGPQVEQVVEGEAGDLRRKHQRVARERVPAFDQRDEGEQPSGPGLRCGHGSCIIGAAIQPNRHLLPDRRAGLVHQPGRERHLVLKPAKARIPHRAHLKTAERLREKATPVHGAVVRLAPLGHAVAQVARHAEGPVREEHHEAAQDQRHHQLDQGEAAPHGAGSAR